MKRKDATELQLLDKQVLFLRHTRSLSWNFKYTSVTLTMEQRQRRSGWMMSSRLVFVGGEIQPRCDFSDLK